MFAHCNGFLSLSTMFPAWKIVKSGLISYTQLLVQKRNSPLTGLWSILNLQQYDQEDNLQDGEINSTVLNLYIIGFYMITGKDPNNVESRLYFHFGIMRSAEHTT